MGNIRMAEHSAVRTPEERMIAEVGELHQFFQDWFNGGLPNSDEGFSRFSGAFHPSFQMVSPDAVVDALPELTESLRGAHGAAGNEEGVQIVVKEPQLVTEVTDQVFVFRYQEHQKWPGKDWTRRLSTQCSRLVKLHTEWLGFHCMKHGLS